MTSWIFQSTPPLADVRLKIDLWVEEIELYQIDAEGARVNGGVTGSLTFDTDGNGRPALHTIVVNPPGGGIGALLMWCFAVSAPQLGSDTIALHGPGDDIKGWYDKLGFISDPEYLQPIVDEEGENLTEDEIRVGARAVPMIGDASSVARYCTETWVRSWDLESQE